MLDQLFGYEAQIFAFIGGCANGTLSPLTIALLVNFAICELKVLINTCVLLHFDGDDARFLDAVLEVCDTSKLSIIPTTGYEDAKYQLVAVIALTWNSQRGETSSPEILSPSVSVTRVQSASVDTAAMDTSEAKSGERFDATPTIYAWVRMFFKEWKRVHKIERAITEQCFSCADRLACCMPSAVAHHEAIGWHTIAIQVLLSAVWRCTATGKLNNHGRTLRWAARDLLGSNQNETHPNDSTLPALCGEIISLAESIVRDPFTSHLTDESNPYVSPPTAYPDISSLLIRNQHLALLFHARVATWKLEMREPYIYHTLHVYSLLVKLRPVSFWCDAEFVIQQYRC